MQAGASLRLPMSYEKYLGLGETKHHEYYDGALTVNPPTGRHQLVARRLARALEDASLAGYEVVPEWGWQLGPQEVYEPDLLVARAQAVQGALLHETPLLVVEVTSRSTRRDDLGHKLTAYARGGAAWYWIVDPDENELTVMRLQGDTYRKEQQASSGQVRLQQPIQLLLDLDVLFA